MLGRDCPLNVKACPIMDPHRWMCYHKREKSGYQITMLSNSDHAISTFSWAAYTKENLISMPLPAPPFQTCQDPGSW